MGGEDPYVGLGCSVDMNKNGSYFTTEMNSRPGVFQIAHMVCVFIMFWNFILLNSYRAVNRKMSWSADCLFSLVIILCQNVS